jgi:hypothetical protein
MWLLLQPPPGSKEIGGGARRLCRLQYTRKHGQAREWSVCVLTGYEPWDPAASLVDLTLGRRAPKRASTPQRLELIGGDQFSGKSGDWADAKTKIVSTIANAVFSYITDMGAALFRYAGSGNHDHIEDTDLEEHFKKKFWPTQLRSIRSQITKSTLDVKCKEDQSLTADEKSQLRD